MSNSPNFAEVFETYVKRDGRRIRQLSHATQELFQESHKVPHTTIYRWLKGQVKKPRNWIDILKLARTLRLTELEADKLLQAAGHLPVIDIRKLEIAKTDNILIGILDYLRQQNRQKVIIPPPFQVPPTIPTFTGRNQELKTIINELRSDTFSGLYCIESMGGVGKSTLAIHLAYKIRNHYPDGVLWIRLDRVDTMTALNNLAEAFGESVDRYTDIPSRSNQIRSLLANKCALLILDNATFDEEIEPLLPPTGQCATIITTRRHDLSLADRGNRLHLQPFDEHKKEGIELFGRILGRERVRREEAVFSKLAQILGHLPLAINIVANRLKCEPGWQPSSLLKRLQDRNERLSLLKRGQQHVRLSFEASSEGLVGTSRELFQTIWVFPSRDFTPLTVAGILDWPIDKVQDSLHELYNLSFIRTGQTGRYQIHPLLRDYSQELCNDTISLQKRLIHYFIGFIENNREDFTRLTPELTNILTSFEIAQKLNLANLFVHGIILLYPFLQTKGLYDQARTHLECAQAILRSGGDNKQYAQILMWLGHIAVKKADYALAELHYMEALDFTDDSSATNCDLLLKLGALQHRLGRFEEAESYYQRALLSAEKMQSRERQVVVFNNIALISSIQGCPQEASIFYKQALALARQLRSEAHLITTLQNYGKLSS